MKRILVVLGAVVLLVLAAQVVGYYVAVHSDAYVAASQFVRSDPKVAQKIGAVTSTTLAPFDAELRFTANTGRARFVVTAQSPTGTHKVVVQLEKVASGWRVIDSGVVS